MSFCLLALLYALSPSIVNESSFLLLIMVGFFVSSERSLCTWGYFHPKSTSAKARIVMLWSLASLMIVLRPIETLLLIFRGPLLYLPF